MLSSFVKGALCIHTFKS